MFAPDSLAQLKHIEAFARAQNFSLYAVGGFVRDIVRGAASNDSDIDLVVDGNAIVFAHAIHRELSGELKVFPDFYTAKIVLAPGASSLREIDFASSRSEIYDAPGALPRVALVTLAEDLKRRDFSINAIALPIHALINIAESDGGSASARAACIDPLQGCADIDNRLIRILHRESFVDDPTRLFRALRYAARIGGQLQVDTADCFNSALLSGALSTISFRRVFNEMVKMLEEVEPLIGFEEAERRGLLKVGLEGHGLLFDSNKVARVLLSLSTILPQLGENPRPDAPLLLLETLCGGLSPKGRIELFNQLSVAKKIRAQIEADLAAIERDDSAVALSASGILYDAAENDRGVEWVLERLR